MRSAPPPQSELLDTLTPQEISILAPLWSEFRVAEDAVLFSEGSPAAYLYVLLEGQIALQKAIRTPHAAWPRRTTVAACQPGELIGWSALAPPYQYTFSAVAWSYSTLVRIHSREMRETMGLHPDLGFKVMSAVAAVISRRLRQSMDALINAREMTIGRL